MSAFDKKFEKIPLVTIKSATNNFADENLIRQGFGKVYRGQLLMSGELTDIVARRLNRWRGQGSRVFKTESMTFSSLKKHKNLVCNIGFCDDEGEMIIISKYEANGSLDRYLSDPIILPWTRRLQICLGIARALSYIHYEKGCNFSVIHRDIKSYNILLDENWEAKISGFGLSLMQPAAQRHRLVLNKPRGSFGYLDPAYLRTGGVNIKSDLYSLGVVFFEVLCGRQAIILDEPSSPYLYALAKSQYEEGKLDNIILAVKKRHRAILQGTSPINEFEGRDLEDFKIGFDAIKLATENFAKEYCIGSGGYGIVYKAELEYFDSSAVKSKNESQVPKRRSTVAIKHIIDREDTQGEDGFFAEVKTLTSCKHQNIVSLLGFCYERSHMILVYPYLSNGSLEDYLGNEGKMNHLTWVQRIRICIDIARGLDYIHTTLEDKQKIIHRDIKSANILLDENWEAKIADFGLSKIQTTNLTTSTLHTNKIVGTRVYWDPEYESSGKLKKESDIYSFGVVLFEILSGRLAYDKVYTNKHEKGLAPIAREHFNKRTLKELVDPKLKEETDENTFTLSKGPNQDSLDTFSEIAHQCLALTQAERPTMKDIVKELEKALNFQETHKDSLRVSLEDIREATQNFNPKNLIAEVGSGKVYKGIFLRANGSTNIAVKKLDIYGTQEAQKFLSELEICFEYRHENIIGLVGYCDENFEKIIVNEYASNGSLYKYLASTDLTWMTRLKICIDVATGLHFLHGGGSTQDAVIHGDLKSSNILLDGDWKAKISDFRQSMVTSINEDIDFVDQQYIKTNFLTRECDIYSLGVILFEIMCGRRVIKEDDRRSLFILVKRLYEEGTLDELVFDAIKDKIVQKSLTTFQTIAYRCLHDERDNKPAASEVVAQLKKALEFQEDYEIWEPKLPRDFKEIIQMSKTPESYSNFSKKDLYDMFCKGILLQEEKVWFSLSSNGKRNEMISSKSFFYQNRGSHKWRSMHKSRFHKVTKMMDVLNLNIRIKIRTKFLSSDAIYGVHLLFKFSDSKTISSKPVYVNLRYKIGSETLHAYFATLRDDKWMSIELCRFLNQKEDIDFEALLEGFSKYNHGSSAIFVEGIEFRAVDNDSLKVKNKEEEKLKEVQSFLESKPNMDYVQKLVKDFEEIINRSELVSRHSTNEELFFLLFDWIPLDRGEKLFSLSKVNGKKCHMLPAKVVLHDPYNVKLFTSKHSAHSRFHEVFELLSHQVFRIKCKIESHLLSTNTKYVCYLVFKLTEECCGLHCPVKVRDLLHEKTKELEIIYLRSPSPLNVHGGIRVPEQRQDGWMEVNVWELNVDNELKKSHVPMDLKLICYEGTMSGLIVYGLEFRPV